MVRMCEVRGYRTAIFPARMHQFHRASRVCDCLYRMRLMKISLQACRSHIAV